MIAQGVEQGIITQGDGDVFLAVHAEMDILKAARLDEMGGGMGTKQARMLAELVAGRITQADAAIFYRCSQPAD